MLKEEYFVAGVRQQMTALEKLLEELKKTPGDTRQLNQKIRTIESKLKQLRDSVQPGPTLS